jgi:hypothetical protein
LPSRLLLYTLYVFIEQFNQPVTALGIAAHQPMLVSLDEWAASLAATIEIIQFPCETPGGGIWISEKLVWPLLQKLGRKRILKLNS